ncbi:MAG: ABC transporter permease [Lachnospiraceae bacterium]|jgi:spermidine/putrescine transport system permease protein|nr:ABC transporter permease [Lachnospiraceae bacterium]
MHNLKRQILAGPYLLWIAGFVLLPVGLILYYALTTTSGQFTVFNITSITASVHWKALVLSLELALLCTVFCLALSYPLAMVLNGMKGKKSSLVVFIFILPMWMNFMLRILAWKMLLSNHGVINTILDMLGLPGLDILNTPSAVVFCMVYDFLPFMVLPIYNAMSRIEKDVIEAARDLGAGGFTVFFKVILPLTMPGVVSGIIMVFVPALTSFAISDLLGGGKVLLIGNVIEQAFMQEYNWNLGSGLSLVLMVFVIASMALMNSHGEEGGTGIC